jgi:hypothetical protein
MTLFWNIYIHGSHKHTRIFLISFLACLLNFKPSVPTIIPTFLLLLLVEKVSEMNRGKIIKSWSGI